MASAIIIGLGSTGLHIVEYVQQFHYQFSNKDKNKSRNKSDRVEYLFCETDLSAQPKGTPDGNEIIRIPLSLKDMAAQIPALKQQPISHEWIPEANVALATGDGAGGQSAYGRLALWMNWNSVYDAINSAWRKVHGDAHTNVYIVGSLTGGTCTGTFIDVAYLARHITGSDNIYGFFLVPGKSFVGKSGCDNILSNYLMATSALKALTRTDGKNVYCCKWVGGNAIETPKAPYNHAYFLSTDFANKQAGIDVVELCRVAALNLCVRIMDMVNNSGKETRNFQDVYDEGMIDVNAAFGGNYRFSTFGTTLIHYPKAQLTEWFGLDLTKEILERWVNPKHYWSKSGQQQDVSGQQTRINHEFMMEFEQLLDEAIKCIDGVPTIGAPTMKEAINNDVQRLKTDKSFKIFGAFNSLKNDNHHGFVANNAHLIREKLVDGIYELLEKYMQEYEDLVVLRNILTSGTGNWTSLQQHIQSILDYWKRHYKVDGDPATFNKLMQRHINKMEAGKTLPKILLHKTDYLNEQIWNLYTICKLHFTVPVLKQVIAVIDATPTDNVQLRGKNHILPSRVMIENMIKRVNDVIRLPQGKVGLDIATRMSTLDNEMSNKVGFKAIFRVGKEDDKNQIRSNYNATASSSKLNGEKLVGSSIFSYIFDDRNSSEKIYKDCVSKGIDFVESEKLVDKVGICGLLSELSSQTTRSEQYNDIQYFFTEDADVICRNLPGHIGLKETAQFQYYAPIKLIYATGNTTELQSLATDSASCYIKNLSATGRNSIDMPSLSHAIVVAQEYGYMVNNQVFNPVTDIAVNGAIKSLVEKIPDNMHTTRCPYISWDALKEQLATI